jgi:hypothetical protein
MMFVTEGNVFSNVFYVMTHDPLFTCRRPKSKQLDPLFTIQLSATTTRSSTSGHRSAVIKPYSSTRLLLLFFAMRALSVPDNTGTET